MHARMCMLTSLWPPGQQRLLSPLPHPRLIPHPPFHNGHFRLITTRAAPLSRWPGSPAPRSSQCSRPRQRARYPRCCCCYCCCRRCAAAGTMNCAAPAGCRRHGWRHHWFLAGPDSEVTSHHTIRQAQCTTPQPTCKHDALLLVHTQRQDSWSLRDATPRVDCPGQQDLEAAWRAAACGRGAGRQQIRHPPPLDVAVLPPTEQQPSYARAEDLHSVVVSSRKSRRHIQL